MPFSSSKTDVGEKLKKIEREAEERDAKRRASQTGYPYIDLKTVPVQVDALNLIPKEVAIEAKCVVLAEKRDTVVLVAYDPTLPATQKVLDKLQKEGKKPEIMVGSLTGIEHIWSFYEFTAKQLTEITGKVEVDKGRLEKLLKETVSLKSIESAIEGALKTKADVGQILEILLAGALVTKGSDIHLEPTSDGVKFRLRVDGLLHDIFSGFKNGDYFFVLSRIKLLAGMKLNIHNAAQDGRFSVAMGEKTIEIRASALPSEYGETIVLRILDPDTIRLSLQELGLRDDELLIIQEELGRPNGMILNTGPTGSGKTTTLYAFLMRVNKPESKIITLEDPIEYHLQGIEQTQVDAEAGYTFANGLRSIVRQDPDVILVGEIRDFETADIALNAALTGHLVFSTLHTNDSFGSIPRLIDLGAKSAIIGPALNLVIAQRLVRRLCNECKKSFTPDPKMKTDIQNFVKSLPSRASKSVGKSFTLYKTEGCDECNGIGYKGQIAIMELLRITSEVGELISKEVTELDIKKAASAQAVVTVQQSGILKVLEGITTMEEVERVTGPIAFFV